MDLVQVYKKDYSLGRLVEDFSSLIWTERYQPNGDFSLVTQAIDYTMGLLPERSLCSLRDSNEVMMVDSHSIEDNSDGIPELTVVGRTVDSFIGSRVWHNAPYGKKAKMAKKYSIRKASEVWLWNAIANGTGNDRIKTSMGYSTDNQLPNVIVTDSVPPSSDGPDQARKVQNGDVYSQLITFLASGKLGIRIIRPNGTSGRRVDVASDGTFSTTDLTNITDLRFDIYAGRDLSNKIVFSYKAGHFQEPKYLLSSATFVTGAFVDGDPRDHYYVDPDAIAGTNAGWNRRDVYVDGGSMQDPNYPSGSTDAEKATIKANDSDDFEQSLEDAGLRAVRKEGRHVSSIDATINPLIEFTYGDDYRLGDRVLLQGQYGVRDKKYVTEFIRSQDDSGELGYPTLSSTLS